MICDSRPYTITVAVFRPPIVYVPVVHEETRGGPPTGRPGGYRRRVATNRRDGGIIAATDDIPIARARARGGDGPPALRRADGLARWNTVTQNHSGRLR